MWALPNAPIQSGRISSARMNRILGFLAVLDSVGPLVAGRAFGTAAAEADRVADKIAIRKDVNIEFIIRSLI